MSKRIVDPVKPTTCNVALPGLLFGLLLIAGCAVAPKHDADGKPNSDAAPLSPDPVIDGTPKPPVEPEPPAPAPLPGGSMAVAAGDEAVERNTRLQRLGRSAVAIPAGDQGYYLDVLYARLLKTLGAHTPPVRDAGALRIVLPPTVTFDHGSDQLAAGADLALDPILRALIDYSALLISIHGHSDNTGPAEVNRQLSARRALTVARRLQETGISSQRLMVIGHGADQPVADNATEGGRQRNRRVELLLQPIIAIPASD